MTIDKSGTSGTYPTCRWCKSSNVLKVAVGAKARWIVEEPSSIETSNLLKCKNCELVFFSSSFSNTEINRMYSGYRSSEYQQRRAKYEPWYTKKINAAIGHSTDVLILRRKHLENLLNGVSERNPGSIKSPTRVLDVGGDEGQFIPKIESITHKAVLEVSGVRPVDGAQILSSWNEVDNFMPDMIMISRQSTVEKTCSVPLAVPTTNRSPAGDTTSTVIPPIPKFHARSNLKSGQLRTWRVPSLRTRSVAHDQALPRHLLRLGQPH